MGRRYVTDAGAARIACRHATYLSGSGGLTSKSSDFTNLVSASANIRPHAAPTHNSITSSRTNIPVTCSGAVMGSIENGYVILCHQIVLTLAHLVLKCFLRPHLA